MKVYDRETGCYSEESQYGQAALRFLYETPAGRILLRAATLPVVSRLAAFYYRHPASRRKIGAFSRRYNIAGEDYETEEYRNFDDFFTRRKKPEKRKIFPDGRRLIAPADAKLLACDISGERIFTVKQSRYSLKNLLGDAGLAAAYEGGTALIFRLTVDDCHRYAFVEDGEIVLRRKIPGRLHTVSSFSEAYPVYAENSREYILIRSSRGGDIVQMEVGALLVGRIRNHPAVRAERGAEKGYFQFGGSTIIVLLPKGRFCMDEDIRRHSARGIETKLRYGETIGDRLC